MWVTCTRTVDFVAFRGEEEKCSCISDPHNFPLYGDPTHLIWIWARCTGRGSFTVILVHVQRYRVVSGPEMRLGETRPVGRLS